MSAENKSSEFVGISEHGGAVSTPIHDFLVRNGENGKVRCCMPGHKGLIHPFDITEIHGADSLFESDDHPDNPGIIAQSEMIAGKLFGSEKTLYSAAGSTLSIHTMLALAKLYGNGKSRVTAGRYSHGSFINACVQLSLIPDWVYPDEFLSCRISPEDVEKAITPDTLCVFVSSIDYYGGMSDIAAIADVCKKHGVPLLVDNAHGAYLRFAGKNMHPNELGAAMCADSAHKTLPALTGAAYLHINDPLYCTQAKKMMKLFASTSPSYLILDSLDTCNAALAANTSYIPDLCEKISKLKKEIASYGFRVSDSDPMRITIDGKGSGLTGFDIEEMVQDYGIEFEYTDCRCCVMLFGWGTSDEHLERVEKAFGGVKGKLPAASAPSGSPLHEHIKVPAAMSPARAFFLPRKRLAVNEAVGKICAEAPSPCPPGIPLIMPGEIITKEAADLLVYHGVLTVDAAEDLK